MLLVNHISKRWPDGAVALDEITFGSELGQLTAIIGPSGAGKSTLLRVIAGLDSYQGGSVANPYGQPGMVFQEPSLWPHLSLLNNVGLALRILKKVSAKEAERRATDVLVSWGLGSRLQAHPADLSGGEQQRGALARACVLEPQLLCLDEITGFLDPETTRTILGTLLQWKTKRTIMLLVTHHLGFARASADQVLFLDAGRIVESGPPETILENPKMERTTKFVSAFPVLGTKRT